MTGLSRTARASRLETIGLQLYTVRKDLEKDFEGTLARRTPRCALPVQPAPTPVAR
jgi:hypothetical protein